MCDNVKAVQKTLFHGNCYKLNKKTTSWKKPKI